MSFFENQIQNKKKKVKSRGPTKKKSKSRVKKAIVKKKSIYSDSSSEPKRKPVKQVPMIIPQQKPKPKSRKVF